MEKVYDRLGHVSLWDWLSKNPHKSKSDWPGWKKNGGGFGNPLNLCFACDYAGGDGNGVNCRQCPLLWPLRTNCSDRTRRCCGPAFNPGLFDLWDNATDIKKRSYYAAQIRDVRTKFGVKYIGGYH